MSKRRQHFDEAFKRQAVQHMAETGKTPAELSQELDVPIGSVRSWRKQYGEVAEKSQVFVDAERLKQLERLNRELQEENEILKKAMHFFTKNRD